MPELEDEPLATSGKPKKKDKVRQFDPLFDALRADERYAKLIR